MLSYMHSALVQGTHKARKLPLQHASDGHKEKWIIRVHVEVIGTVLIAYNTNITPKETKLGCLRICTEVKGHPICDYKKYNQGIRRVKSY
jgi:hypothetical protein